MAYPYILYTNNFDLGVPTATNTAAGYNVLNIKDSRAYTYWMATGSGTLYLTINCATATAADTLGIFKHNLGTCAATVSVDSSTDGASWTPRLVGYTQTDNYAILKTFNSVSAQYWRLKIVSASVTPYLAICIIGARMTFVNKPRAPLSKYSIGMEVLNSKSKTGNILGSTISYNPLSISLVFPPAEANYTFWGTTFKTFWTNHGKLLKPFFFCLDYDTFPGDVFWVTLSAGMRYELNMQFSTRVETFSLNMEGIAE